MMSDNAKVTRNIAVVVLASAAILAGAYYYFDRARPDRENLPPRPNPDFTTAPEGGVKVNLPETPMTNVPSAPPVAGAQQPGEAEASRKAVEGGDDMPVPTGK